MKKQHRAQPPLPPTIQNSSGLNLLTANEAAQAKGVTRSAVYKAIAQGRLPHHKLLGRVALHAQDVKAWTPTPHAGRPVGTPMSEQAKTNIAAGQKRQWAEKKQQARQAQNQHPKPAMATSRRNSAPGK